MATKTKRATKQKPNTAGRPATDAGQAQSASLLRYLESRQNAMIGTIRHLVQYESPTENKAAVDVLGRRLAEAFQRLGGRPRFHAATRLGDHLQVEFAPPKVGTKPPLMLLGHFDTVWPLGTLRGMPFRIEDDRLWGPGVLDMKAGIAQMIFAIEALQAIHGSLPRPLAVFLASDEEIGSHTSRRITATLARSAGAVLVAEPAFGLRGALKTARKGVGEYRLTVKGKAAHAGLDFEKGDSAILELARQLLGVAEFTDPQRGITVNAGVIRGGTRTNVVAAEAWAEIDVRISSMTQAREVARKLRELKPFNSNCQLRVEGGINRPPLERTPAVERLFRLAQRLGGQLGLELDETAVGGASDGNFTAALGIPTLDGLGAVGEDAHAEHESVLIDQLVPRTALLARMLEEI